MLDGQFISFLEEALEVKSFSSRLISSGEASQVYVISNPDRSFVIKCTNAKVFPNMLRSESEGLNLLRESATVGIAKSMLQGLFNETEYLVLEYVEEQSPASPFWSQFGEQLAELHRVSSPNFGLDHDNYIGPLHQTNTLGDTWSEFYTTARLIPQTKRAYDAGLMPRQSLKAMDNLCSQLANIYPKEPPALLHGDLWSGNFLCNSTGEAVLIDPAVYFGHREMDIGMSLLFGGFETEFYGSYENQFPMESGWKNRLQFSQLYPVLVHLNIFGKSYLERVLAVLKQF